MSTPYTTITANLTPPSTSPPVPPFQALTYLITPTSPHARILALLIFLIPASLLLSSITLYRTHLLAIPPPTTHAHLSGPWAAEMALGSLSASLLSSLFLLSRLSFTPHPLSLRSHLTIDILTWATVAAFSTTALLFSNTISWGRYEGINCGSAFEARMAFSCQSGFGTVQGLELGGVLGGWVLSTYHGLLAGMAWRDVRRGRETRGQEGAFGTAGSKGELGTGGQEGELGAGGVEGELGVGEEESWGAKIRKPACTVYA